MKIRKLKINGITNPLGFKYRYIRCSWKVEDTESKKAVRTKITVSCAEDFSEILYTKEGAYLEQSGELLDIDLQPRTRYFYKVAVWGDGGDQAESETAYFETGKMDEEWQAKWLMAEEEASLHPVFVRKLELPKKVTEARLYVACAGLFEAYLNGEKIGDEVLAPYLSHYEKNLQAITMPADGFQEGENRLEILLGKGWFTGAFYPSLDTKIFGSRMAFIAELHVEYEDGSTECILSDREWQYKGSNIEDSGIYDGEILNDLLWEGKENPYRAAVVYSEKAQWPGMENVLKAHIADRTSLPVKIKERLAVQEVIKTPDGDTVLDFGQNFAGFIEIRKKLPARTRVILDFAEFMEHGRFYKANYNSAKARFEYIADGQHEVAAPHFTYCGMRYVKVEGWPGECTADDFSACVIYSDVERTGEIVTGHQKINRLYQNTLWSLKSNFVDIPTDCPQRSERLGWTADAQVFAPTASYHVDTQAFYDKFLSDLRDEQEMIGGAVPNYIPNIPHKTDAGSVWGDAATFIPDTLFQQYGNVEQMKIHYPLMRDWVDYITRTNADTAQPLLYSEGFHFGDWLALDGVTPNSFVGATNKVYIASVYYYRSAMIVSEMAAALGKTEDELCYGQLAGQIYQAIIHEFFTPSGRLAIDTQTGYIIALKFGIHPDRAYLLEQFKERLKKDCYEIKCGFVGGPLLCTLLAECGLSNLAYDFLFNEQFPGWLYEVNLGATTIWERWNSVLEDGTINPIQMNSLNHYAYGSVMEFLYKYGAGIRPAENGFKRAVIAPEPDIRLGQLAGRYESVSGTYISEWKIENDGQLSIHISIPFGCTAEVFLPGLNEGVKELPAGSYDFCYMPINDYRKPYDGHTTLKRLGESEQAMEILKEHVPIVAGMIAGRDKEMCAKTLTDIKGMEYLPVDSKKLEEAIEKISNVYT